LRRVAIALCVATMRGALAVAAPFPVEEAGIADLQNAIQDGRSSCKQIVQAYLDRARAYNGACTALVTKDGANIPQSWGTLRATRPLKFPTRTVAVASVLPDFANYKGLPIEYGRMEATASDPSVKQQFGMVVGVPDAGQLAALTTLNIRGERSVTCKGDFDRHPSKGPLPPGAPAACEQFRRQPDALERAAELDRQYGRNPDLAAMPMYCVAFSFKDVYDTTDMRTTGGADANYAMDAAPRDSTLVAELRAKGAIVYAKANLAEYNGGSGDPGGKAKRATKEFGAGARSTWGGPSCNPYDTERETGGSSSGSAVSVGANLVTCSICEETGGSCRQPAWRNGVVGLVTTKGLMGYGGAIGADPYLDRAGIQCRSVTDAARVLDALKDPQRGYFDPRDPYSALPKALVPANPYASFVVDRAAVAAGARPLAGLRVGIVREYMVAHAANDRAISQQMDAEIKNVLRDQLGAELVESKDPAYPGDPEVPDLTYTFQQALAEILPMLMPEYLVQKKDGKPVFDVPGQDVASRDYMARAALGLVPVSDALNIRTVTSSPKTNSFSLHLATYLMERGDARVKDWVSLNANAKYYTADRVAAMQNWADTLDIPSEGITQRVKMRDVMRMVVNKVMQQNRLDILVNPTTTVPPARIGQAAQPSVNNRPLGRFPTSADLGIPEITVPAGFNSVIYEPAYVLNEKQDDYVNVANEQTPGQTRAPLPVGLSFWAGVGEEPMVIRVASAYEAATGHRRAPPAFGPVAK
jgi:Asp-tRNA(Asn)/Glu-tRNA(Gln) amidotransferase A subunit family amidase